MGPHYPSPTIPVFTIIFLSVYMNIYSTFNLVKTTTFCRNGKAALGPGPICPALFARLPDIFFASICYAKEVADGFRKIND